MAKPRPVTPRNQPGDQTRQVRRLTHPPQGHALHGDPEGLVVRDARAAGHVLIRPADGAVGS